jgi:hypothetical protein
VDIRAALALRARGYKEPIEFSAKINGTMTMSAHSMVVDAFREPILCESKVDFSAEKFLHIGRTLNPEIHDNQDILSAENL